MNQFTQTPTEQTATSANVSHCRLREALDSVTSQLMEQQNSAGFWEGQLSSSALSTATAVSALSFYLRDSKSTDSSTSSNWDRDQLQSLCDSGLQWLVLQQNDDGGFGDTDKNYSNISTTMLVLAAVAAADRTSEFESLVQKAEVYVEEIGGIPALRARYGRDKTFAVPILANCAMAGIVNWKEVSALPFEASVVPQRFYNLMQLPVVSYAIPALVAIGQAKFVNDPPWNPLSRLARRFSVGRSLKVLNRMQPASGGFLEAIPLTSFVAMGLINANQADHPVVDQCIRFIVESFRVESAVGSNRPKTNLTHTVPTDQTNQTEPNDDNTSVRTGSWPIDTNLSTWNTTLAINSMSNFPSLFEIVKSQTCLLYTSPSPRDLSTSRMPSSA